MSENAFARYFLVITGGPCAGKTTCLSILEQELREKGFEVIIVAETATEIITSGLSPQNLPFEIFESTIIDTQLSKEAVVKNAISHISQDVVVIFDRGLSDCKAYLAEGEYEKLLSEKNLNEISVFSRYDAVFHLVTAADGAEEFYTLANNQTRRETAEEARETDKKTWQAWLGHPHLRIIGNETDFKSKVNRLMSEIFSFIGIPVPIETERKYLIKKPNNFPQDIKFVQHKIIQTYLKSDNPKVERRIRQRGDGENFTYYYTEKSEVSSLERVEIERKISEKEYLKLLLEGTKKVRKDRYCFAYKGQYFELDIYPHWSENAILEIELTNTTQTPILPDWIEVIKEVTEDTSFRNFALAE